MVEVLAFSKYTDLIDLRRHCAVLKKETQTALTTTNKIYYSGDTDQRLKKAALKLFNLYNKVMVEDYLAILDLREIWEDEEDYDIANAALLEMNEIHKKFSALENILDLEFAKAQRSFARENQFFLDPSGHPLQEDIDNL